MSITVTTQAELDAVVDSGESIVIESDGLFEIRGTSRPIIHVYGTSKPTIKTCDTSRPIIWTFDTSEPTILAYGTSAPSIGTYDTSEPIIRTYGTSAPIIGTYGSSAPIIGTYGSSRPIIVAYDKSHVTIWAYETPKPIVRIYGTTARVYVDGVIVNRPPLSEDVQMPKTQGDKDKKPEQMSRVPVAPLLKLSKHFFKGSQKYNDISPGVANWSLGVPWSSSYDALQRSLLNWWNGEDLDEDGNENLVAAMWHVCVLLEFTETHPELDDRPKRGRASADE